MMILGKKKDDRYDLKGLVERNPKVMKKLQDELQNVIGMGRMVEEKDLEKLDYLYMVVKESLKATSIAPFPRECTEDTTIEGYHIPRKSRIIVNVIIGHDQNVVQNVEEFCLERFIEKNIDIRGNDFDLIPFGSCREYVPECNRIDY
ncbi:hypothetical protein FNV43_RR01388 [Rhamnella rubrinervis]|uniref:Cytochrome P450 n=1 Tax=Rhamnella rubrinervis TaxID=2594499 RepID=A0A8K0HSF9_9ROSA|nr:hypothetical protein FNV43_RR01388 [Rhamnella rubrinervis]